MEYEINKYFQYTIFDNSNEILFTNGVYSFKLSKEVWNEIKMEKDLTSLKEKINYKIFDQIINTGFIVSKGFFKTSRYSRTYAYNTFHKIFTNLELNKKIIIFGAGGTGSWMVYLLKNSGFKNITVLDFDTVEISNLNRQIIYTKNDIGLKKVDVLNNYFDGELKVMYNKITTEKELLDIYKNYDYVFKCIDKPFQIHRWFYSALQNTKIPYFSWMINGSRITNTSLFEIKNDANVVKVGGIGASHPYMILNCVLNMFDEFQEKIRFDCSLREQHSEIWKEKQKWKTNQILKYLLIFIGSFIVPVYYIYMINIFINKTKINLINGAIFISIITSFKMIIYQGFHLKNLLMNLSVPLVITIILYYIINKKK